MYAIFGGGYLPLNNKTWELKVQSNSVDSEIKTVAASNQLFKQQQQTNAESL